MYGVEDVGNDEIAETRHLDLYVKGDIWFPHTFSATRC